MIHRQVVPTSSISVSARHQRRLNTDKFLILNNNNNNQQFLRQRNQRDQHSTRHHINDYNHDRNDKDDNVDSDEDNDNNGTRSLVLDVVVKLKSWQTIRDEAGIGSDTVIDVLNVDCAGCEYNLIPSLSEYEFRHSIKTIVGSINWGYIPLHHLPSSNRGNITHYRLCHHESFARKSIECCQYPSIQVISSVQDELLILEKDSGSGNKNHITDHHHQNQQQQQQQGHEQDAKINKIDDEDIIDFLRIDAKVAATVADISAISCTSSKSSSAKGTTSLGETNFEQWAVEHKLFEIPNDYGWFHVE
jgi:hypothetical protein